jgi:glycosyltransferase involved in cell wall biosynthesis
MESFFPVTIGKTVVIPNGHEVERFSTIADSRHGKPPAKPHRLLMLGDMDRRKNVQCVLRCLPLLRQALRGSSLELHVAGKDAQRSHFAHLERMAAGSADIRWLGYVPDAELPELYRTADVFLFPSLWEGFGIPVLEAMSAGVPVVCSDLSSLPEIGGEYAWYCDPYDPQSIADAIAAVLTADRDTLHRRLCDARRWAAEFTWSRAGQRLVTEIFSLASSDKPCDAHMPGRMAYRS